MFYGFYVGPAKLQRGATPPSVMVLLLLMFSDLTDHACGESGANSCTEELGEVEEAARGQNLNYSKAIGIFNEKVDKTK